MWASCIATGAAHLHPSLAFDLDLAVVCSGSSAAATACTAVCNGLCCSVLENAAQRQPNRLCLHLDFALPSMVLPVAVRPSLYPLCKLSDVFLLA